jgi:NAD(P)H dehydrogenase (quinone)
MKHLVIISHPNPESFCKAIVETVFIASDAGGFTTKVKDLYAENN